MRCMLICGCVIVVESEVCRVVCVIWLLMRCVFVMVVVRLVLLVMKVCCESLW